MKQLHKFKEYLLDLSNIAFIGPIERHIRHGAGTIVIPYFKITIQGQTHELMFDSSDEAEKFRNTLLQKFEII